MIQVCASRSQGSYSDGRKGVKGGRCWNDSGLGDVEGKIARDLDRRDFWTKLQSPLRAGLRISSSA